MKITGSLHSLTSGYRGFPPLLSGFPEKRNSLLTTEHSFSAIAGAGDSEEGKEGPGVKLNIPGSNLEGDKMILGYTCSVCDTRSHRLISKHSYENGTVLVLCEGCDNKHLIVDHLGVFGEKGFHLDDLLKERGEEIKVVSTEGQLLEFLPQSVSK